MLFPIVVFSLFQSHILAQSFSDFPRGLGVEIGGGQNTFYWSGNGLNGPFGWTPYNRTDFHLTPNARLTYQKELASAIILFPFLGYNHFGGTATENGNRSEYSFHALELGGMILYGISNVDFGVGFKENYNLYIQYDDSRANVHDDYTKFFPRWSDNVGFRGSYTIQPISFGLESWFGISNLAPDPRLNVRENHFRFLVGYTL